RTLKAAKTIWMDGKFVDWDAANTHVFSHGLNYGYGILEGMRCNSTPDGPAIFRLEEHIDRLVAGTKIYRMSVPYSKKEIMETCVEVVRRNGLKDCYIRPIFFGDLGELSVNPLKNRIRPALGAFEWGDYLGAGGMDALVRF